MGKLVADFDELSGKVGELEQVLSSHLADWQKKYEEAKRALDELQQMYLGGGGIRPTFDDAYNSLKTTFDSLVGNDGMWEGQAADKFADALQPLIMQQLSEMDTELDDISKCITGANESADIINTNANQVIENVSSVKEILNKIKTNNENSDILGSEDISAAIG